MKSMKLKSKDILDSVKMGFFAATILEIYKYWNSGVEFSFELVVEYFVAVIIGIVTFFVWDIIFRLISEKIKK